MDKSPPSTCIGSPEALTSCRECDNFSTVMLERDAKLREITEIDAPESSVIIPSAQCVESELLMTLTRSLCKGSESNTTPTANKRDMLCVLLWNLIATFQSLGVELMVSRLDRPRHLSAHPTCW